jgi:hypothetical protein
MSGSWDNPGRQRRRRHLPPQSRRRRPQPRRPLLPPRRRPPQPRLLLPQVHRLPWHLHRLPLQIDRLQRRVATPGVSPRQNRQRTVPQGERTAIPALVAPHHPKTIARALPRTSYQNGSAANPTWRGRVTMVSAAAPGAVVNTDLLPRRLPFLPGEPRSQTTEPPNNNRWPPDISVSALRKRKNRAWGFIRVDIKCKPGTLVISG